MLCQTEQFCIYQCVIDFFLLIPVSSISLFIPVQSSITFVYTSHYSFIEYTSAPVEVSVWLGGIPLKSVYGAFCVQDAVQVE